MIRKFEMKDTKRVMQIWLEVNMETHDFIPSDYWLSQYQLVRVQTRSYNGIVELIYEHR